MIIHRIQIAETNCYLLCGEGGVVIIDPGPAGGAGRVIAGAEEAGIEPRDVRLILVSHGHLDHYGAAPAVKEWYGAPIGAHVDEPAFSQDRRNALPPAGTVRGSIVRWFYLLLSPLARFEPLEADILLEEGGADLAEYGLDAQVIVVPGHSPGSLAVVTAEGDAFVGDLFVNYTVPSQPLYVLDREAWQKSYERVRALEPEKVYVGHGEPFAGETLDKIYPARYQMRWWVR
jgi:hydroxyacylglutathione hydrolase